MDITYRFVASGHDEVKRAFTGIEAAARQQKKAVEEATKATRATASARPAASAANREARAAERQNSVQERLAQRPANAQVKAQERAAKHVSGIRDRHFRDEQRKEERHAAAVARTRIREATKAARLETKAREKAKEEASERRQGTTLGKLGSIAGGLAIGAAASGTALVGAAAREAMQLQEASARIAISARGTGEKAADPNELRKGFERTAINSPGQTAAGVADAVARFVSLTGDLGTALKSQDTFATISSASGANIGDVAEAAASLSQQFDIKGLEDMREALSALTFQGKNGAFELKDAAAQFQRLAASGASFGIPKGVGGVKVLGGLTQIARSGTGSSEQAATAVENLLTNLKVKQTELKAQGVSVFKDGKARDVRDLIVESISKVGGGDMAKKSMGLTKIFGEQGIRAINPLVAKYATAFQGAEGKDGKKATDAERTAAGVKALRDAIAGAIDAPGNYADAQEDAAMAQAQASAKVSTAWESIKAKTADSLLPSLGKLADKLGENGSALDPFIEAVGFAVDGLAGFSQFLKDKGMLSGKKLSPAEAAAKAKADLEKFDTAHAAGPLSAEDFAARQRLEDASVGADFVNEAAKANAKNSPTANLDNFVDQYTKADTSGKTDWAKRTQAEHVLKGIKGGDAVERNDFMMRLQGESEGQRDIRQKAVGEKDAATTLNVDDLNAQLAAVTAAAATTAAALTKTGAANQPSNI